MFNFAHGADLNLLLIIWLILINDILTGQIKSRQYVTSAKIPTRHLINTLLHTQIGFFFPHLHVFFLQSASPHASPTLLHNLLQNRVRNGVMNKQKTHYSIYGVITFLFVHHSIFHSILQ